MIDKKSFLTITENNAKYIIAGLVFITYLPALKYPFIQDDWGIIYDYFFNLFSFSNIFAFKDKLFFRPFGQLYTYLYLIIFGIKPFFFHLISLIVHSINSYLIFRIIKEIFSDYGLKFALFIGCMYGVASSIHYESLLWMVGIYEIGSTFFFFLSIFLFIKSKNILSGLAFALGICFKESGVIFIPMVLLSYILIYKTKDLRKELIKYLPHLIVIIIFVLIRLNMASPLSLSDDDPYKLKIFSLGLVGKQLFKFTLYSLQSVFPYGVILLLICSIVFLLFLFILFKKIKGKIVISKNDIMFKRKDIYYMIIWFISGLSSVFFLVNHAYRYYLTLSLPALIFLFILVFNFMIDRLNIKNKNHFLNVLIIFSVISSIYYVYYSESLPYSKYRLGYGTNGLIGRGKTVDIISKSLIAKNNYPPGENIILIDGIDVFSFNKNSGPSVWLKNKDIKIYDMNYMKADSTGIFLMNPLEDQGESFSKQKDKKISLDSNRTHAYFVNNNTLENISWKDLKNYKTKELQSNNTRDFKEYIIMLLNDF